MNTQIPSRHSRLLSEASAMRPAGRLRPSDHLIRAITHEAIRTAGPTKTLPDLDADAGTILKAATAPGGTGAWGSHVTTSAVADFIGGLTATSAAAALFSRALNFEFDRNAKRFVPAITTGAAAAWVSEHSPIPVTSAAFAKATLEPRKLAALAVLSREILRGSGADTAVRVALSEAATRLLDSTLFDAGASSALRPAGLLNGITAITGAPGGDDEAMRTDLNALVLALTPVSAGGIVLIVSPSRAVRLSLLAPTPALPVLASGGVAETAVIAIAPAALAVAFGGVEIDTSNEAVLHMSDTPAEIVAIGDVVADPARALWQTDGIAIRLILGASWALRGAGLAWVSGATW